MDFVKHFSIRIRLEQHQSIALLVLDTMNFFDLSPVGISSLGDSRSLNQSSGLSSVSSEGIVIMVGGGFLVSDRKDTAILCFFIYW